MEQPNNTQGVSTCVDVKPKPRSSILCGACGEEEPVSQCGDCGVYLCDADSQAHRIAVKTRNHTIRSLSGLAPANSSSSPSRPIHDPAADHLALYPTLYLPLSGVEKEDPAIDQSNIRRKLVVQGQIRPASGGGVHFGGTGVLATDEKTELKHLSSGLNVTITCCVLLPNTADNTPTQYDRSVFMTWANYQGVWFSDGFLHFYHFYTGSDRALISANVSAFLGRWVHIAFVLSDRKVFLVCVNGCGYGEISIPLGMNTNSFRRLTIGGRWSNGSSSCTPAPSWPHALRHFAVYPRALTDRKSVV